MLKLFDLELPRYAGSGGLANLMDLGDGELEGDVEVQVEVEI